MTSALGWFDEALAKRFHPARCLGEREWQQTVGKVVRWVKFPKDSPTVLGRWINGNTGLLPEPLSRFESC